MDYRQEFDDLLAKIAAAKKPAEVKDMKKTKADELELWKVWKKNGQKPEDLDPLLTSFAPLIRTRMNMYRTREISTAALEFEHKKELVNALKTFDPSKGAQLGTHVNNRLLKVDRFVKTNTNFARIPENVSNYIGHFNNVKAEMASNLGYEPDIKAIHEHLLKNPHEALGKPSMKFLVRLQKEQRKSFISGSNDSENITPAVNLSSRDEEVVHLIMHQLTPEERSVHEYVFGLNGKPTLKPGEISKKLGMDNSKVSKLKASILKKMEPHLDR